MFHVYSKVIQLYIYTYILIFVTQSCLTLCDSRFFSIGGYYFAIVIITSS